MDSHKHLDILFSTVTPSNTPPLSSASLYSHKHPLRLHIFHAFSSASLPSLHFLFRHPITHSLSSITELLQNPKTLPVSLHFYQNSRFLLKRFQICIQHPNTTWRFFFFLSLRFLRCPFTFLSVHQCHSFNSVPYAFTATGEGTGGNGWGKQG